MVVRLELVREWASETSVRSKRDPDPRHMCTYVQSHWKKQVDTNQKTM